MTSLKWMNHIEFIGPPGVGKSAICYELAKEGSFFYGTDQEDAGQSVIDRIFLQEMDYKYRIMYRAIPPSVRLFFNEKLFEYRLRYIALEEFVQDYPSFMGVLSTAIGSASYDTETIFFSCKHAAERYQLGVSAVKDSEILCLDESFAQRAFSVLWRTPDGSFSLEKYFDAVPTPQILIHVDAPAETCLQRQQKRGRVTVDKDWESENLNEIQEKLRQICFEVSRNMPPETTTVLIENTGDIRDTIDSVKAKIDVDEKRN